MLVTGHCDGSGPRQEVLGKGTHLRVELLLVLKGGWDTLREDSRAVRRGGVPGAKPPSLLPGRESLWDTLLCQQP